MNTQKQARCIFCKENNSGNSIEHIVPESLGNDFFTLDKGVICDKCNNLFSNFESVAINNTILVFERARFAVRTKKGKPIKGKIGEIEVYGDGLFRPHYFFSKGATLEPTSNKNEFNVFIPSFHKSEVPTSKFLLKIGIEALYKSQRTIYNKYQFTDASNFICNRTTLDWPFITSDTEINKFISIPRFNDKLRLKKSHIILRIDNTSDDKLIFKFKYGRIPMLINLLNRNIEWIINYLPDAQIYPAAYRAKVEAKNSRLT